MLPTTFYYFFYFSFMLVCILEARAIGEKCLNGKTSLEV